MLMFQPKLAVVTGQGLAWCKSRIRHQESQEARCDSDILYVIFQMCSGGTDLDADNVLESAFRRQHKGFMKNKEKFTEDSILHKIKWHRIVLDEAHNIKVRDFASPV